MNTYIVYTPKDGVIIHADSCITDKEKRTVSFFTNSSLIALFNLDAIFGWCDRRAMNGKRTEQ